MTLWQAIVYGITQGITEFLPISSAAHLRIVAAMMGWEDPARRSPRSSNWRLSSRYCCISGMTYPKSVPPCWRACGGGDHLKVTRLASVG